MTEPNPKEIPTQTFLSYMTGRDDAIRNGRCTPFCCGRQIYPGETDSWTDDQLAEYQISGMCDFCQGIFNGQREPDEFVEVQRPERSYLSFLIDAVLMVGALPVVYALLWLTWGTPNIPVQRTLGYWALACALYLTGRVIQAWTSYRQHKEG